MEKLFRRRSTKTQMNSGLTKVEMDAVLQLIQLRRCSAADSPAVRPNLAAWKDEENKRDGGGEGGSTSAAEALPSALIDQEKSSSSDDDEEYEPLPRRKRKFGSLVDIYKKTRPLNKKRARF